MKTNTSILLAAIIGAGAIGQHAQAAEPWRMYRCTGSEGETVFSDKQSGTDCREIWLSPRPQGLAGPCSVGSHTVSHYPRR
jgi:hypothetical protein